MKDLALHLALFLFSGSVIVLIGTFFSEPEDSNAWRALPRRLGSFFLGCAVVVVVMTVCEHTLASIH